MTVDTNGAVLVWGFWASPASLSTYANGGLKILYGEDVGNFWAWDCSGSDFEPNPLGGWYCYALDPAIGSPDDTVGSITSPGSCIGLAVNCTAQARGYPFAVNAVRVGRCTLEVTNGQAGDYGTFSGMESFDTSTNQRYGLFQSIYGAYRWQGLMSLGTTATAVDFRDGSVSINIANTPNVSSSFNKIEVHNASSNVEWTNVVMSSPGVSNPVAATASPGAFEMVDNATLVFDSCIFSDMTTFIFLSNGDAINSTFLRCAQITHGGGLMAGTSVAESTVAAGSGAIYYNEAADPDGEMDDMSFSKGTNAHSAIEFGTTVTSDITLRGMDFTGFGSTDDINGAVFKFLATSGSLNLNLVGCTTDGAFSVDDTAGITVTVVINPVTEKVNVKNKGGDNLQSVRVLVETAATIGSGEMFEAAVTSLTQSGGTATCDTTAVHGLVTGDKIVVRGAQPDGYNKVATVTVTDTDTFTYSVDSGLSSPATGTPIVSFVAIHGTTDINGDVSASRTWTAAQQLKGWARKKSITSPFYKDADIAYTVDTTNGNTTNVVLQPDE